MRWQRRLLALDSLINLVPGAGLLLVPRQVIDLLGLPATDTTFYASVLGAVLVWLLIDPFEMPTRGYVVLWTVVVAVLGTALLELRSIGSSRAD